MKFNKHSEFEGQHAFLSASKYHWINYDEDKLVETYLNYCAAQRGTELHDLARRLIEHGIRLPKQQKTLNLYVNDAIGYKMTPEQVLYFSPNCFGTADAIAYRGKKLRIHDLKTGVTPTSVHQLEIYASLFFLEYKIKPTETEMELRIYQNDDILVHTPEAEAIQAIMDKIRKFDARIEKLRMEV